MTIFELVKLGLDELYEEGKEEYGGSLDAEINKRMLYLTDSYNNLGNPNRERVNYKDPATRFAYVYKYVSAHADFLVQVMQLLRSALASNVFTSGNARISCVGGGPGSDIIAVLQYLIGHVTDSPPVDTVTCYLLDREQAWADTWADLALKLKL